MTQLELKEMRDVEKLESCYRGCTFGVLNLCESLHTFVFSGPGRLTCAIVRVCVLQHVYISPLT